MAGNSRRHTAQELIDSICASSSWRGRLAPVRAIAGMNDTTIGMKRALASEHANTIATAPCPVAVSSTIASCPGRPQINSVAITAMSAP